MATGSPLWSSRTVAVGGVRTHLLEAGDRDAPPVVLVHHGGHGATVEEAWEFTIPALAEHFYVVAPEQIGFGRSDKLFDFADPLGARVRQIAAVLDVAGVQSAHFIGISTAGTMMLSAAVSPQPAWPIDRIVGISAVGERAGGPDVGAVLRAFDGTFETMDGVIGTLYPERWWDDAYVDRRLAAARSPGAWQCVAAEGFRPPWAADSTSPLAFDDYVEYERIERPVLLVGGAEDKLRRLEALHDRASRIPDCRTHVFDGGGHMPHVQFPDEFNALALDFLRS